MSWARQATARQALVAARDLHPDVVLLDVQLPGDDGFAVAETLAADPAAPAVVLVSSRSRGDYGITASPRAPHAGSSPRPN